MKMTATMIMGAITTEVDSIVQRTLFSSVIRKKCFKLQTENKFLTYSKTKIGHNNHCVILLALFDMPNLNRFDILSISIFCKIALSISISIFSKITISISISIFLELPYRYRYRYFSELPYR